MAVDDPFDPAHDSVLHLDLDLSDFHAPAPFGAAECSKRS